MREGLACSALMAEWSHSPRLDRTAWEEVTLDGRQDALVHRSWHETHVRGLDRAGVWLGPGHLARIDRASIPRHVSRTELGDGLRLTLADDTPRAALASLESALAPLLPSPEAAHAWEDARRR